MKLTREKLEVPPACLPFGCIPPSSAQLAAEKCAAAKAASKCVMMVLLCASLAAIALGASFS